MTLALRFARSACVSEPRFVLSQTLQLVRHSSSNDTPAPKPKQNPKLSREGVRQNVKGLLFSRFFGYVKEYDKILEKNFPTAVQAYRVFFDGVKVFFADMKTYLKISRIANDSPKGPRALNRRELELYLQMPRDMWKVAPTILLSSLPMVGYAVFPLAYMYPKTFLTSHFWTIQQKSEFQQAMFAERLKNNRPVFRYLQARLKKIKDKESKSKLSSIFGLLGSGHHPSVEQILEVKDIFAEPPFNFNSIGFSHIKSLAHLHGVPGAIFRRQRIAEHAYIIHYMDVAITREGGVHNMLPDAIRNACLLRGLNPRNLSHDDMVTWMRSWVAVSTSLNENHLSLFLHLPIFLTYNHPNNWQILYGKR